MILESVRYEKSLIGKGSLLICCELNSLIHKIDSFTIDNLIKMILFGDGCSAMVILAEEEGKGQLMIEGK